MRLTRSRLAGFGQYVLIAVVFGVVAYAFLFVVLRPSPRLVTGLTAAAGLAAILTVFGALWVRLRRSQQKEEDSPPEPPRPVHTHETGAGHGPARLGGTERSRPAVNDTKRVVAAAVGAITVAVVFFVVPSGPEPRLLWSYTTSGPIAGRPAVADGRVFVGSSDDSVYGISLASPHHVWIRPTGGSVLSSPAVADGVVYIGSGDGYLYALSAATGKRRWRYRTGQIGHSSPAVVGHMVYIGASNGNMYGLWASGKGRWVTRLDGPVQAGATVASGTVFVGTLKGTFYALSAVTGHIEWTYSAYHHGGIWSTPVADGGLVYFGSGNCHVYALKASDGHPIWNMPLNDWFQASPALADGVIYIGDMGQPTSHFYAIGASHAQYVRNLTIPQPLASSPAVAHSTIYIGSQNGRLYAISSATFHPLWSYPTHGAVNSSPVVSGGVVYVGSNDGSLYALRAAA
jgi:outer membrane protein assembly factor BamB